jgi:hypothetical protein
MQSARRIDPRGRTAAIAAAVGFGALAAFQLALAAGAPLGEAAWGGGDAALSSAERVGSAIAVAVWASAAVLVLGRAGLGPAARLPRLCRWATWALVALSAVAALTNIASPSRWENLVWAPIAVVLAVLCAVVAHRAPDGDPPPRAARARTAASPR